MIGESVQERISLHTRNNSEKRLLNRTSSSFYIEKNSRAPKLSKFYVTGQQFNKPKAGFSKQKDR
jgi:hypothetical protein